MNSEQLPVQMLEQMNRKLDTIINLLEKQTKNQSYDEVLKCQGVLQLSIRDLVELYVARVERASRCGRSHNAINNEQKVG